MKIPESCRTTMNAERFSIVPTTSTFHPLRFFKGSRFLVKLENEFKELKQFRVKESHSTMLKNSFPVDMGKQEKDVILGFLFSGHAKNNFDNTKHMAD